MKTISYVIQIIISLLSVMTLSIKKLNVKFLNFKINSKKEKITNVIKGNNNCNNQQAKIIKQRDADEKRN